MLSAERPTRQTLADKKPAYRTCYPGRSTSRSLYLSPLTTDRLTGKNKTIKKAKNGHDPNWDPTRDHSELAARVAIDKFNNFAAREHR